MEVSGFYVGKGRLWYGLAGVPSMLSLHLQASLALMDTRTL
jgi:hypothetical protein